MRLAFILFLLGLLGVLQPREPLIGRRDGHLQGVISLSDLAQHQPGSHLSETLQRITAREVA